MTDRPDPPMVDPDAFTLPPPTTGRETLPHNPAVVSSDSTNCPGTIPGYQLVRELGRGGMGVVYEARQVGLNRSVALKMILSGGHASLSEIERFRTGAEVIACLQHPNILQIHDMGRADGLPYFTVEFCPGGSLDRQLDGTPWEPRTSAALVETLARAMNAAHGAGIVHRDLKPANILLAADGTPKVADFDLAKRLDVAGQTQSGAVLGTPSYMAPEQAGGKAVGPAADVYALGAILYELLTGRPPFKAATPLDTILQVVTDDPVPPTDLNPKTPRDLETIALKCLDKDPERRYATAAELADDLRRFQNREPILARPARMAERITKWARRRPAVAGLATAVVVAITAGFAGVYYQLGVASAAREWAEDQERLAKDRASELSRQADILAEEQSRVRRELHRSDLLRSDLLMRAGDFAQAEHLLWRTHMSRPDDDDRRAEWRLWDLYRQRPRRAGWWSGEAKGVRTLTGFSPDGRRVAVVRGSQISVHDTATGAIHAEFQTPQSDIEVVSFGRNGSRVALVSTADGSVTVWDLDPASVLRATLRPLGEPKPDPLLAAGLAASGHSEEEKRRAVRVFAYQMVRVFLPDDQRAIVTGADDGILWDLNGPTVNSRFDLETLTGFNSILGRAVLFAATSTGDEVAVVRAGEVQLWRLPKAAGEPVDRTALEVEQDVLRRVPVKAGRTLHSPLLSDHGRAVSSAALTPDGKCLVTADRLGVLRTWDLESGRKLAEAQPSGQRTVTSHLAVTRDGTAARTIDRGAISLWRLPGLQPMTTIPLLSRSGYAMSAGMSANGQHTILDEDGTIATYDHADVTPTRFLDRPGEFAKLGGQPDIVASGPAAARDLLGVTVWGAGPIARIAAPRTFLPQRDTLFSLTPNGLAAVGISAPSALRGTTVSVYDLTARTSRQFSVSDPGVGATINPSRFAIAPDNRHGAILSDRSLLFVDVAAQAVTGRIAREQNWDWAGPVVYSPDGRTLALLRVRRGITTTEQRLVLLDVEAKRILAELASEDVIRVGFSPDGSLLATVADRRLILRHGRTLAPVAEIPTDHNGTNCYGAFSPDGRIIALATDSRIRFVDVSRREELVTFDPGVGSLRKVVFTPDGSGLRFVGESRVGELDLRAFDSHVAGNRAWNVMRLASELEPNDAARVLERWRMADPAAYQAGFASLQRSASPPGSSK